ncbi:hypothetical protein [Methylovirgula sp. 4M-Z18]|uniref:hypothetical protein n=1 Tax=Methylovirgula sp. 4M-Z18 TaxID=2293567 RepID=UPI000E2E572C|nr:hypothetical protein [Methylovirgula sp. 4M-Z18]RFB79203.1 hypothetical protein DYH55_11490 [Methylovirgula sp. 4M-Z18]
MLSWIVSHLPLILISTLPMLGYHLGREGHSWVVGWILIVCGFALMLLQAIRGDAFNLGVTPYLLFYSALTALPFWIGRSGYLKKQPGKNWTEPF